MESYSDNQNVKTKQKIQVSKYANTHVLKFLFKKTETTHSDPAAMDTEVVWMRMEFIYVLHEALKNTTQQRAILVTFLMKCHSSPRSGKLYFVNLWEQNIKIHWLENGLEIDNTARNAADR